MPKHTLVEEKLEPLFNPRSIAVIGATNMWSKWGFSTFASILNGFAGKVYPVNDREDKVLGHRAFKRVSDIPDDQPVDLAIFVIPSQAIPEVMEDCVKKGVRAGVIISAGFAEIGEHGKRLQDKVLAIARQGSLCFTGPNCMGLWSASSDLRAFMFPLPVRKGPIAFVSQGGNVGSAVLTMGYDRGVGFHRYVSCGCTADIQIEDYIEHFGRDPEVQVILAYIEGLEDGVRFIEKVKAVSAQKPVIALKPGRTPPGIRAITSHSGVIAGSSDLYDSAFKKGGVIRVYTTEQLLDVAIGFLTQPLPKGNSVAIITPGGSYGVISADACASLGLEIADLEPETIAEFDKIFPPRWSKGNPVDPAGNRDFIAYMQAPELLLKLPKIDSLVFMGFDSFSNFSAVFATISNDLAGSLRKIFSEFSMLIPEEGATESVKETLWMEKLIGKIVESFFSFFGTSDLSEVAAFAKKQGALAINSRIRPELAKQLRNVIRSFEENPVENIGEYFAQVFDPLLQALMLNWIEFYGKPVITTSFNGQAAVLTELGHYAYPFAEQAIFVLSKLLEYRKYLDLQKDIA